MNYAVLTYQYADNPKGIPSSCVADAVPLVKTIKNSAPPIGTPVSELVNWPEYIDVAVDFPVGDGWLLMTEEELQVYKESKLLEYQSWLLLNKEGSPLSENYKVQEYTSDGMLTAINMYQDKVDGVYINLAKSMLYTYLDSSNSLKKIDTIIYDSKGVITLHEVTSFFTDTETNKIITETEYV